MGNTAVSAVVVHDKSGCLVLYSLNFLNHVIMIRVPDCRVVFQVGAHQTCVSCVSDMLRSTTEVPSDGVQGSCCLGDCIIYV